MASCGARVLGAWASQYWRHRGPGAPQQVKPSLNRYQTRVPCIGKWILNYCTTREVLFCYVCDLHFRSLYQRPSVCFCWLKKHAQCESCASSFIWGKTRTITWETAFQRALWNCSREAEGSQYICTFGEGGVHAIKHIFCKSFLLVSSRLVLVTRNSRHNERFWCFSRYEEI